MAQKTSHCTQNVQKCTLYDLWSKLRDERDESVALFSLCSSREPESVEMNKLRQSLRRKKPTYVPEASRPHQWQADEEAVRKGKCSFAVRVGT